MAVIGFPDQVSRILSRADFRDLAAGVSVRVTPDLPASFQIAGPSDIVLHSGIAADAQSSAIAIRHALELLLLQRLWPALPPLAGLAAARTAALFATLERSASYVPVADPAVVMPDYQAMTTDASSVAGRAASLWASLAVHQPGASTELPAGITGLLTRLWPVLGSAEWLMQHGSGQHSSISRAASPNFYQWTPGARSQVVDFASEAASSISIRGYGGAEAMRQAVLRDILGNVQAVGDALANVRGVIRTAYDLPPGTFITLAPSGVEGELFALAIAQGHPDGRAVTVVMMAPEEVNSGVSLAVAGRHFAPVTARGVAVERGTLVDGFRSDTQVAAVALRTSDGAAREPDKIAAECASITATAVAAGRRVLLHQLDTSKTGLLAPGIPALRAIQERHAGQVDIVVDASQARLSPDRVWEYLALGWIVLLTGSEFLNGPPSSGAMLVPETLRDRFARALPKGLQDYSARVDWPPSLMAPSFLSSSGDVGLALRWAAALAELRGFDAVPVPEQQQVIGDFVSAIRSVVCGNADLLPIATPAPQRSATWVASDELAWNGAPREGAGWDEAGTIISFALHDPAGAGLLTTDAVRRVHEWLQVDVSGILPQDAPPSSQSLARQPFHIGQPITLSIAGREAGVLSISASVRLVSAEPSYLASSLSERLVKATNDAEALLHKVSLLLRYWPLVERGAPSGALR